jgi:DNA (cytosine-5)-methyltransferase 1
MKQGIIYLDLFSGVGGFAKGFHDAGMNILKHYFSEIDKHAIAVYKYNFKNAQYAGDVRYISEKTFQEKPDIITFGFPCQDLSVAGRRKGLSGPRSGLFFEAIRIIKEFRPEVFIFENVKGLLSSNNGKDFEIVLRTIADIGLYECEWQLVNTAWVLPQNRERIYFVGHLRGYSSPRIFPFRKSDSEFDKQQRHFTENKITQCLQSPGHVYRNYKGMNAVAIKGDLFSRDNAQKQNGISDTMFSLRCAVNHSVQIIPILTPTRKEKRQNGRRFKENGEPAFTLNTQDMHGVQIDSTIRRLTEIECERLQGFPDNWTKYGNYDGTIKEVPKTHRYKQMGNAVTTIWPQIIATRLFNQL